jgi:hypothetical protein
VFLKKRINGFSLAKTIRKWNTTEPGTAGLGLGGWRGPREDRKNFILFWTSSFTREASETARPNGLGLRFKGLIDWLFPEN